MYYAVEYMKLVRQVSKDTNDSQKNDNLDICIKKTLPDGLQYEIG